MIGIAVLLVVIVGPLLLGLTGLIRARQAPPAATSLSSMPHHWRLTVTSALLYALAFNLTFFIQELFLVLPKAFTPGLRPTLFHNNHTWEGEHPLASLFQGTGALAIFLVALGCALVMRRRPDRSPTAQLFLIWMAYNGCFQSLPQVIIGAVNPRNDVGMAMDYLHLSTPAKTVAALVALAAIPPIALWLIRPLASLADEPAHISTGRARTSFIFYSATLPALIAIPLIIAFRVPRELIEVVVLPMVVTAIGITWMQAGAWRFGGVEPGGGARQGSITYPLAAVLILLLVFQLLLRPGVPFY